MWGLNDFFGVNAPNVAERLSVIALAHLPEIAFRYETLLATNRPMAQKFFEGRKDLEVAQHPFGTILFPRLRAGSVETLCQTLREKYQTSVVPGAFFEAPEHFRMYLAADTMMLNEDLKRLRAALDDI